jgi:hypothetical protein
MMANKWGSWGLVLLSGDCSKNADKPLSTNPVDKFVDFLGADGLHSHETSRKSAAIKISAVVSGAETGSYGIESASMRNRRGRLCQSAGAVH